PGRECDTGRRRQPHALVHARGGWLAGHAVERRVGSWPVDVPHSGFRAIRDTRGTGVVRPLQVPDASRSVATGTSCCDAVDPTKTIARYYPLQFLDPDRVTPVTSDVGMRCISRAG